MGDVITFRSQFDIDCEAAVAAALFGPSDGGKSRIQRRRQGLGLRPQAMPEDNYSLDSNSSVDVKTIDPSA